MPRVIVAVALIGGGLLSATSAAPGRTGGTTNVVHWNGHTWSTVSSANPTGTHDSSLSGVACATSTSCEAVGSNRNVLGSFTLGLRGS